MKTPRYVIARSDFRDAAISQLLIFINERLLRYARKDGKKTFSTAC